MYMLHIYNLYKLLHKDFPIWTTHQSLHCNRINNCRYPKVNRQITTLYTQDLDHALTCCAKMVQQISHSQQRKEWMEQHEVATTISLKHYIHSSIRKFPSHGEDDYSNLHFLIKQCIRLFATKSSHHKIDCLSRTHKVSSCWATTNNLIAWDILVPKDKELDEGNHHQCLTCYKFKEQATQQLMGATIHSSPTLEAIQLA
jgi:hypothetical protein